MVLDQYVRDYKAFMDEFASALDSERTKFYLDTSLLIWLIRLGVHARGEVFRWLRSRPANSVRIPVWAGHELHRHILRGTARKNLKDTVDETRSRYGDFVTIATERADDLVCIENGFENRSAFIRELELSSAKFTKLASVVALDNRQLQGATKEVIDFANEHMLSTNLGPIIKTLKRTGQFRTSHFIPPGFQDKKEENTYGDLVIWEEILKDLRSFQEGQPRGEGLDVVFISRDQKTDWVSAAPFLRKEKGDPQRSNRDEDLDVSAAHPLLVHELVGIAGGKRLFISQPGFLASVIDFGFRRRSEATRVAEWLAASHRPDMLSKIAGVVFDENTVATKPLGPSAKGTPESTVHIQASQESKPLLGVSIKNVIVPCRAECAAYHIAAANVQEEMVRDWVIAVRDGGIAPAKLGRIFAELVLANEVGFTEQIPALFEMVAQVTDEDKLNDAALALITGAYFDSYGELRTRPVLSLGSVVLFLEKQDRLKRAFKDLAAFLRAANAELPYTPGSGKTKVKFVIDAAEVTPSTPRSVRNIRLDDQSVLIDALPEDSSRTLSRLLGKARTPGCQGQEIRLLICREFLIPLECLSETYDRNKFTWQTDAGLVVLDTSSPGGLSASVDEETE